MTEATDQVPVTEPTEAVTPTATPAATGTSSGAAAESVSDQDYAKARRKIEALEKAVAAEKARADQFAESQKTEAEKEREKAIADAKAEVKADYEARIARQTLESSVLLHLGSKVGADAAKLLVPAVLATDPDLVPDDVPAAVEKILATIGTAQRVPGGQGGAPSAGTAGMANPWAKGRENITEQIRIQVEDPNRAKQLALAAGVHI